jgi:glutamyl-Q tRNA(Asp) synthetase
MNTIGPADSGYIGRFAPSPTGPLHAGSLVAAMASYLDARAHHGQWRVRIEDVDEARTVPGAAESILQTLAALGMHPDGEVIWQSRRGNAYAAAFARLHEHVYPCACSRREIADSNAGVAGLLPPGAAAPLPMVYPGTCRQGMPPGRPARAWRLRVPDLGAPDALIGFQDRACGWQQQHLVDEVGDFVLKRADGFWAYQLAVVVDDAEQGVTDVVRGMDLLDSTPRQIWLQRLLGIATPRYLHAPLVRNAAGEKLSKQTGAAALDLNHADVLLQHAAAVLGLPLEGDCSVDSFWQKAVPLWAARFMR